MSGYLGKILIVDLSTGNIKQEQVSDDLYKSVLSGLGLGVSYLYKNIPADADPLGEDNILGITSGLLTGTGALFTGRWMAMCKSPLTGGWGDSNCGGTMAIAIKQCGYDAIFFHGISKKPVYLYVDNKGAVLKDASKYWGIDAIEAEETLIEANYHKKKPSVAVIGPAAEKKALISGISSDMGRYAARSGVGAVMGSKLLKAIVLAGTKQVKCHDSDAMRKLSIGYANKVRIMTAPKIVNGAIFPFVGKVMGMAKNSSLLDGMLVSMLLKKYGSVMNNTMGVVNGDSPIKNWKGTNKDYNSKHYKKINPDGIMKREYQKYHCYSCPLGCGGICKISDLGNKEFTHTHKPEYETVCGFAGLMMNSDMESILYINELCNRSGFDTISASGVIAFAIECYEEGLITSKDTGGLELKWGDTECIVALLKLMIKREGIGDVLADGVKVAAKKIGKNADDFAVHAGGQEAPMHDPKIDTLLASSYSADPTPGKHTTVGGTLYYTLSSLWKYVSWAPKVTLTLSKEEYEPSEKEAHKNMAMTAYKMIIDGTGGCYYSMMIGIDHNKIFDVINAGTGWGLTPDEYMEMGKRIQLLRQVFNIKHGVDPKASRMHKRMSGEEPLTRGVNKNITLKVDDMMRYYWQVWGWDEKTGVPKKETIMNSKINEIVESEFNYG